MIGSIDGRICVCDWSLRRKMDRLYRRLCKIFNAHIVTRPSPVVDRAMAQLDEYFKRQRTVFDLPLAFAGTDFQRRVWDELNRIGYGETSTYSSLASSLGCRQAVRAVANAIAANAMSILVPCHRIIGSDGSLTGYAGGIEAKRYLLSLERGESTPAIFSTTAR